MSFDSDGPNRRSFLQWAGAAAVGLSIQSGPAAAEDAGPFVEDRDDTVRLGNKTLVVTVDRATGGITQVTAQADDTTLRRSDGVPATSWAVEFYSDRHRRVRTAAWFAGRPSIVVEESTEEATVRLRYEDPQLRASTDDPFDATFQGTVTVTLTVRAGEPLCRFDVAVANDGSRAVSTIDCPTLSNVTALADDGSDAVITGRSMGRRFPDPTSTLDFETTHRYPGTGAVQFAAYTGPDTGFYADARDTKGHAKSLRWGDQPGAGDAEVLRYRTVHEFPSRPGADVSLPYTATFGVLDGDWYDAADRYRAWADKAGLVPADPPEDPEWLRRNGATYRVDTYRRGREESMSFERAADLAIAMRERIGTHIQLSWKGWSTYGAPAGGDWFPPAEGHEAFTEAVARVQEHDIDLAGYVNLVVGLQQSDWWQADPDAAAADAVRTRDGDLTTSTDEGPGGTRITWVHMEAIRDRWQRAYRAPLRELASLGATQMHLDGFPIQGRPDCWADHHDHPVGRGGNWFAEEMAVDLADIRSELRKISPEIVLEGEGINDFYLPEMGIHVNTDVAGMLTGGRPLREDIADVIPLFQYTYDDFVHTQADYARALGTALDHRDLLRLIIGRTVAWGAIPRFQLPVEPDADVADQRMLNYLGRVARARTRYANRFVMSGAMLRQPTLDTGTATIDTRVGAVTSPELLGGAWRSSRGEVGLFLTNVTPREASRETTITVTDQPFDLPDTPLLVYSVRNGTYRKRVGTERSVVSTPIDITLEPEDVLLLVIAPATSGREAALEAIMGAQDAMTADATSAARESLAAAKRAFEADNLDGAVEQAETAVRTLTSTPTDTNQSTPTDAGDVTPSASAGTATSTVTTSPGFGLVTATATTAGTTVLLRWLLDDD